MLKMGLIEIATTDSVAAFPSATRVLQRPSLSEPSATTTSRRKHCQTSLQKHIYSWAKEYYHFTVEYYIVLGALTGGRSEQYKRFKKVWSKLVEEDYGGMDHIWSDLLLHVKHQEVYWPIGLPCMDLPAQGRRCLRTPSISEERIWEMFEQAAILSPRVPFIDEINTISVNRVTSQKDMERRIVAQLLSSLDGI
ncbi:peroxisome assembly factor-2 [Culex quinquefasciatus]|uniref:Peroxisome assembly factor-2 n=1 Tax=Culex quinquefasciatus TaxID=7176 RepID=B0XK80_CULQU|nr:peroxisome assembly factor-2 [Culex quinquefasciatus]|eukprot:XP_001870052.1 peroxisome assembly factor-2 [Culex quinquefasciatus]